MKQISLEKVGGNYSAPESMKDPEITSTHYKEYYGIDINKLPQDVQKILTDAYVYGPGAAIMFLVQKLQQENTNVEPATIEG